MSNRLIAQMDLGLQRLTAQPDMPRPVQKLSAADIAKVRGLSFSMRRCTSIFDIVAYWLCKVGFSLCQDCHIGLSLWAARYCICCPCISLA